MASLYNNKISTTYVGLIKTIDNAVISASLRELTDGSGNATGIHLNNAGDFKVTNILEFGSLKDTGENITITKFVDEADGIANNDNDTTIPTSAAVVDYVAARITLEDLDFSGDSGTGSVDLDSQVFAIVGTANEIETSAGSQQLQIGLPTNVTIGGNLSFGDNGKAKFGASGDLEIYHNGSNSYIDEGGTGSLYVRASDSVYITKADGSSNMAQFTAGGGSFLYFNNNLKLNTSSDGISVTGGVTATGGSVFTSATFSSGITVNSSASDSYFGDFIASTGSGYAKFYESSNNHLSLYMANSSGTANVVLNSSGVSFIKGGNLILGGSSDSGELLQVEGTASFTGNVSLTDNANARFGDGNDLRIYHNGTNSNIENFTGNLQIIQNADDSDIIFKSDDGSGGSETYFFLDGSGTTTVFSKNTRHDDSVLLQVGSGNDAAFYHNATDTFLTNSTGHLKIRQFADDKNIVFDCDDGSGGVTTYLTIDGNLERNIFSKNIRLLDDVQLDIGSSDDFRIVHTSANNNTYVQNFTGDLQIENHADNKDILFRCDDNSGGLETYFFLDGSENRVTSNKNFRFIDNAKLELGTSQDLEIYHDASNSYIKDGGTGSLKILADDLHIKNANDDELKAYFDTNGEVSIYYDNQQRLTTSSAGVTIVGTVTADGLTMGDNEKAIFGTGGDLEVYHSGSTSYISDIGTGDLKVLFSNDFIVEGANGETCAKFTEDASVELYENNVKKFETTSTGASVTGSLGINTTSPSRNLSVHRDSAGSVANFLHYTDASNFAGLYIDVSHSTNVVTLNASGSSGATWDFQSGNTTCLTMSSSLATFAGGVTIAGDLTVNGTTTTVNTSTLAVEDPLISMAKDNSANSVDIGFYGRYNDGSNRYLGLFADASDDNRFKLFKGTTTEPTTTVDTSATGYEYANILLSSLESRGNIKITSASSPHLEITDSTATCTFKAYAQDSNAHIGTMTNHSFVIDTNGTAAITLDTSQNATFAGNINLADSKNLKLGAGQDLELFHDGTDSYIQNSTGDLEIINYADDKRIEFKCDDGSGGIETYFYCDGAGGGSAPFTVFPDAAVLAMGSNHDTYIQHTGSVGKIDNYTGDYEITNHTDDGNLLLRCDNGSGGTAAYIQLDGGEVKTIFLKDTRHNDNVAAIFGTDQDLQIFHDGSHSRIKDVGAGHLTINATDFVVNNSADTKNMIIATDGGSVNLYYNASQKFRTVSGGIEVTGDISNASSHFTINSADDFNVDATGQINLDAGGGYIRLKDDGTEYGKFSLNSDNFRIYSSVQDGDILLQGNDGGSTITALTLDMSEAGAATFNSDVTISGSHLTLANGTTYAEATDYLYIGGSGLDSADASIYLGHKGDGSGYGWRFKYMGSGSGNNNSLKIVSENAGSPKDALVFTQDGDATFGYNLGIGDSSPSYSIEINQADPQIRLEETTSGGNKRLDLKVNSSTSNAEIGANQSAQSLILQTTGSDRLTIDSSGNSTFSGDVYVDGGDITITKQSGSPVINMLYDGTNPSADSLLHYFNFKVDYSSAHQDWGAIEHRTTSSATRTKLNLNVKSDSGNVQTGLSIEGQASAKPIVNTNSIIAASNISSSSTDVIKITQDTTGAVKDAASFGVAIQNGGEATNEADLIIKTAAGGSLSEVVRVTGSGSLLVNTTSNQGVGGVTIDPASAATTTIVNNTSASGAELQTFRYNSTQVGSIALDGTTGTNFNTSSDYRLKEDLQDFNGLDKVSKIKMYDFKWKADGSRGYGVMAHELEEVLPQAVSGEKDAEEMQQVDYSKIVPLLVKSIQELKTEIEELKKK